MAGINVPQYSIFKINTNKLKYYNWDLTITKKEAYKYQELVELFESQAFRIMSEKILKMNKNIIDFSKIFIQVVINKKSDFARATSKKGIIVNGENYKRFVGTNGGLKNDTLIFCNSKYIDELNKLCDCNRNKKIPLVPAKFESYKALTCSASQPIYEPKKILVVKDCITNFTSDIIYLKNNNEYDKETKQYKSPTMSMLFNKELKETTSDGFNLCTIDYMKKIGKSLGLDYIPAGVCLRNAWVKGMLYAFPIIEFIEKYNNGNYIINDIWGNPQDIREVDMILTESSFKLWSSYQSIDDYVKSYKENGYVFSVTKIVSQELEEQHEVNYQYLQSYELSDEDVKELCDPTVNWLKGSMGGNYEDTIKFLGINENSENNSWQKALFTSPYMLKDPYIINSINRYIRKKINDAKIGKLFVDGNYQLASGDPFSLMQSICGFKVTGLLSANECYSKFWIDRNEDEIVAFRSPMTCHNNIRKCKINNSKECHYWYRYMPTIMIINSWDSFMVAENGCD